MRGYEIASLTGFAPFPGTLELAPSYSKRADEDEGLAPLRRS